jgi:Uma2 family endonuclease
MSAPSTPALPVPPSAAPAPAPSAAPPPPAGPDVPTMPIYRLSVDQYHAMLRHGILVDGEPVELIEGWLAKQMGKNNPHIAGTRRARWSLARLLPAGWFVDTQNPVTTADSEPEPDVLVARGTEVDALDGRKPGPQDVALVVEVADSTLAYDQTVKQTVYARASIPVYWIVNLVDCRVEVYTQPSGPTGSPAYGQRQDHAPGDAVPVVLDGQQIGQVAVNDLLP